MHLKSFIGGLDPEIRSFSRHPGSVSSPSTGCLSGTGVQVLRRVAAP
jgi:hypothetical protein